MTAMTDTCWADPLSREERTELAAKLAHASKRFWGGQYAFIGKADSRRSYALASAEMQDLYLDVTERAEVPPEVLERAGKRAAELFAASADPDWLGI